MCKFKSKTIDPFGYRSCGEYIVIFAATQNTITNEERETVKNILFAKHYANELLVIKIIHKFKKSSIYGIHDFDFEPITFKVGEITKANKFDEDHGIHYFKTKEPAYLYDFDCLVSKFNKFTYKEWFVNGNLKYEIQYKNGVRDGVALAFHEDGKKKYVKNYKNSNLYGEQKEWFSEGDLMSHEIHNWHIENGVSKQVIETIFPK
jgi:antitoxin component YwqK of YwqJK toxin-antitoxin module